MIQTVSLSTNQTLKILKIVRKKFPNETLISPNMKYLLIKRNQLFMKYFTTQKVVWENNQVMPATYCHDVNGFIEEVSELEKYDYHDKQNVLGSDVGKGAFLVTLTQPDAKKNGEMQAKMKNMVKKEVQNQLGCICAPSLGLSMDSLCVALCRCMR